MKNLFGKIVPFIVMGLFTACIPTVPGGTPTAVLPTVQTEANGKTYIPLNRKFNLQFDSSTVQEYTDTISLPHVLPFTIRYVAKGTGSLSNNSFSVYNILYMIQIPNGRILFSDVQNDLIGYNTNVSFSESQFTDTIPAKVMYAEINAISSGNLLSYNYAEFLSLLSQHSDSVVNNFQDRFVCVLIPSDSDPGQKTICWLRFKLDLNYTRTLRNVTWDQIASVSGYTKLTLVDAVIGQSVTQLTTGQF